MSLKLFDYQLKAVEMARQAMREHKSVMLYAPTGSGKCLGKDTPIMMYDGTIKMVQDVIVGDQLFGPPVDTSRNEMKGTYRNVMSVCRGYDYLYEIKQSDGITYVVNSVHIMSFIIDGQERINDVDRVRIVNIDIEHYLDLDQASKNRLSGWKFIKGNTFYSVECCDIKVRAIGFGEYFGFELDGNKLFCLGDFTVTHNTEIAIHLLNSAKLKSKRSAMVLDRIVLCDQTSERLDRYKIDHGVQQAGHWRNRKYEPIQVCSAQTLEKKNEFPDLSLLIVDEAHQTRKKTAEFIKNANVKVIGLSASPFTKGLGSIYTQVINVTTYQHLIENVKQLVPLEVYFGKEIDMSGAKTGNGEWLAEEVAKRSTTIVGDVVQEWERITNQVFGKQVKTIVFSSGVAHGQDMARRFCEKGFNFISISYLDSDEYKKEILADFNRDDTEIQGVISTDILTKGFDCPSLLCMISARPFKKSFSQWVQQMGRVMRSCKGKEFGLLIDHSGNYLRFESLWTDLYYNGVTELDDAGEKPQKERTKEEKEERTCPSCKALWSGGDTCSHCGYRKERKSEVEEVAGEMVKLERKAEVKMIKADYMAYCKWMEKHQGWSDKRTAASYKGYYDVWPRGLSMIEPKQPTAEFFEHTEAQMKKYLTKQRRAGYAKAKEKVNGKTA